MSDKVKTLSQAIRLGATFRPQCHNSICRPINAGGQLGTCALGAAIEATFGFREDYGYPAGSISELAQRFPELNDDLKGMIEFWNDHKKMTREQIADRLDERMGRK